MTTLVDGVMACAMSAIAGVYTIPNFVSDHASLYRWAVENVPWDDRIKARKTASYGVPYNYAGLEYPPAPFPIELESVRAAVSARVGFDANNCLLNYYPDGRSRMGYHSDSSMGLVEGTGVAIVSLGVPRKLRFRRTAQLDDRLDYPLEPGSLLFMEKRVQAEWQHAVPRTLRSGGRISLTFRAVDTSQ